MGTTLDIKIKRANKVYHAGVSGGVGWAFRFCGLPGSGTLRSFPGRVRPGQVGADRCILRQVRPPPGASRLRGWLLCSGVRWGCRRGGRRAGPLGCSAQPSGPLDIQPGRGLEL